MASNFYKRTSELFEEFQKRELQYLNAERASKSSFPSIKSMSPQKYLETLNEREKENEEAYRDMMRHMEQLDQHAESITDKLRKLESLRMSMSSTTPVLPYSSSTYDKSFYNYTSSSNGLETNNIQNDTFLRSSESVLLKQKSVECASTQTDLLFCENCQFPLTVSALNFQESSFPNDPLSHALSTFENQSLPPKNNIVSGASVSSDIMQNAESSLNLGEEKLSVVSQSLPKIPEETLVRKEILQDKNQTFSVDVSVPVPLNTESFESEIKTSVPSTIDTNISIATDSKESVDEIPIAANLKENIPDVRLNDEFNILKSDNKKESDSNLHSGVASEVVTHTEINKDSNLSTNIAVSDLSTLSVVTQNVSELESEGEISTSKNKFKKSALKQDAVSEKGSESPISITGAPSPSPYSDTASALSDSDSFNEKELLKESAAYQALLGNVSASKKIQKTVTYSESESEDEVERALANATRKSSSIPTTATVQEEKSDESRKKDIVEPKAKNEPRKSISLGKSQQLSKSTRKVLGLDTSSGSEGEVKVPEKPSQKTEDSDDEFFYD